MAVINARSSGLDLKEVILEKGHTLIDIILNANANDLLRTDDNYIHVTASSKAELVKKLEFLKPDIIFAGSEEAVSDSNEVAWSLGLPHNDMSGQLARCDKAAMIEALQKHGVPAGKSFRLNCFSELENVLNIDWPAVVKPPSSSGSDSVKVVHSHDEMVLAVSNIFHALNRFGSENTSVVVQEFLEGPMYVVNTVSRNGVHLLTDIYHKDVQLLQGIPLSMSMVLCMSLDETLKNLVHYTFDCLDSLGISHGPAHSEIILTANGPKLVEVNSRLMGPAMPSDVFVPAMGHSQATSTVDALDDLSLFLKKVDSPWQPALCVAQCQLRPHTEGTIQHLRGLNTLRQLEGFAGFRKLPQQGMLIKERFLTTASTGIVYFHHEDEQKVRKSVAEVQRLCESGNVFGITS